MSQALRVLLVDDQPIIRSGFAMMLSVEEDIEVVGEAADGADGVRTVTRLRPDVVLLDVRLPDTDGFALAAELTGHPDGPAVVVTSTSDDPRYPELARRSGALGFVSKHDLGGETLRALLA